MLFFPLYLDKAAFKNCFITVSTTNHIFKVDTVFILSDYDIRLYISISEMKKSIL